VIHDRGVLKLHRFHPLTGEIDDDPNAYAIVKESDLFRSEEDAMKAYQNSLKQLRERLEEEIASLTEEINQIEDCRNTTLGLKEKQSSRYRFDRLMVVPQFNIAELTDQWHARFIDIFFAGDRIALITCWASAPTKTNVEILRQDWIDSGQFSKEYFEQVVEFVQSHLHDYFQMEKP